MASKLQEAKLQCSTFKMQEEYKTTQSTRLKHTIVYLKKKIIIYVRGQNTRAKWAGKIQCCLCDGSLKEFLVFISHKHHILTTKPNDTSQKISAIWHH